MDQETKTQLESNIGKLSIIIRALAFYKKDFINDPWITQLGKSFEVQQKVRMQINDIINELKDEIVETNKLLNNEN
jgi:hypothetical protein